MVGEHDDREQRHYYLLKAGSDQKWGPLSFEDLEHGRDLGTVTPDTWIQVEGSDASIRANQVAGLFDGQRLYGMPDLPAGQIESNYPRPKPPRFDIPAEFTGREVLGWVYLLGFFSMGIFCCGPVAMLLALSAKSKGQSGWEAALGFAIVGTLIGATVAMQMFR